MFLEEYDPTIGDSYRKQFVIDGEICLLDILDTSGNEEFRALDEQYIREAEGFLIVFALDNDKSFSHVRAYMDLIMKMKEGEKVKTPGWHWTFFSILMMVFCVRFPWCWWPTSLTSPPTVLTSSRLGTWPPSIRYPSWSPQPRRGRGLMRRYGRLMV